MMLCNAGLLFLFVSSALSDLSRNTSFTSLLTLPQFSWIKDGGVRQITNIGPMYTAPMRFNPQCVHVISRNKYLDMPCKLPPSCGPTYVTSYAKTWYGSSIDVCVSFLTTDKRQQQSETYLVEYENDVANPKILKNNDKFSFYPSRFFLMLKEKTFYWFPISCLDLYLKVDQTHNEYFSVSYNEDVSGGGALEITYHQSLHRFCSGVPLNNTLQDSLNNLPILGIVNPSINCNDHRFISLRRYCEKPDMFLLQGHMHGCPVNIYAENFQFNITQVAHYMTSRPRPGIGDLHVSSSMQCIRQQHDYRLHYRKHVQTAHHGFGDFLVNGLLHGLEALLRLFVDVILDLVPVFVNIIFKFVLELLSRISDMVPFPCLVCYVVVFYYALYSTNSTVNSLILAVPPTAIVAYLVDYPDGQEF